MRNDYKRTKRCRYAIDFKDKDPERIQFDERKERGRICKGDTIEA